MRMLFSPQVNNKDTLTYEFIVDKIIVTLNGEVDEFDFTDMPDGRADNIESHLTINPVQQAYKINGVLHVILLNFIDGNATEEERFPDWIEV